MKVTKVTSTKFITDNGLELNYMPENERDVLVNERDGKLYVRYLVQDFDPESPDKCGDESLFLVNYHSDFEVTKDSVITQQDTKNYYRFGKTTRVMRKYWLFKLNAYIHSGVVLGLAPTNFPDERWDVSHVGLVLVHRKYWKTEKEAKQAALSLVNEWNMYLSSDVWGMILDVFDAKTKCRIENECESVWGGYDYDYCMKELREEIK